jgi:hypothetical protein
MRRFASERLEAFGGTPNGAGRMPELPLLGEVPAELGVAGAGGGEGDDGGSGVWRLELLTWNFEGGSDEGADAVLPGGGVGAWAALEAEVVGDGDGRVAEFGGAFDEGLR